MAYNCSFCFIVFQGAVGFHSVPRGDVLVGSKCNEPGCVPFESFNQEGIH